MEQIKISAKALGEVALDDFCERCYWIKLKSKKLPFQIFPGIFSSLDSYQKKIAHVWIQRHVEGKEVPHFIKDLDVTGFIKAPHWSKFFTEIPKYGIRLNGMLDDIWTLSSGKIHLVDFKTARYTKNQDKLLGMYKTQLNGYAMIASSDSGFPEIDSMSIIYNEPVTDEIAALGGACPDFFKMQFNPKFVPVEVDTKSLDPLLAKTRELYDSPIPAPADKCKDCESLSEIIGFLN